MNRNYQTFLKKIDEEESIRYLKEEYPQIIHTFQDIPQLSLENMFKIVIAAEKDCYKLTAEIEQLKNQLRSRDGLKDSSISRISPRYSFVEADEQKEILFELESQLQNIVQLLAEHNLIDLKFNSSQYELTMSNSVDLITEFVQRKCLHEDASHIMHNQLQEEISKQKIKNFELQIDNMKIVSNIGGKRKLSSEIYYNRQRIKQMLTKIKRNLASLRSEYLSIRQVVKAQYGLFKDKDALIDGMKIQDLFLGIYKKLLERVTHLNLKPQHKQVQLILKQSKDLNSHSITQTVLQLKKKHQEKVQKVNSILILGKEFIVQRQLEKLMTLLSEVWKALKKLGVYNNSIFEVFNEKSTLEGEVRKQMESLLQKTHNDNMQLKMMFMQRALNQPIIKRSIESWNDLRSL